MSLRHSPLIFVLLFAAAAGRSGAQESADSIHVGARVLVHGVAATPTGDRAYYLTGTVVGSDERHLDVRGDGRTGVDTLPYFAMSSLMVNEGSVPRATMQVDGMLVGAAVGVGVWGLFQVVKAADGGGSLDPSYGKVAVAAVPTLALVGFACGSLFDNELWVGVRIPGGFDLPKR